MLLSLEINARVQPHRRVLEQTLPLQQATARKRKREGAHVTIWPVGAFSGRAAWYVQLFVCPLETAPTAAPRDSMLVFRRGAFSHDAFEEAIAAAAATARQKAVGRTPRLALRARQHSHHIDTFAVRARAHKPTVLEQEHTTAARRRVE